MRCLRGLEAELYNIEILKDIENFDKMSAARGGRWHGVDLVSSIFAFYCLTNFYFVVSKVFKGEDASAFLDFIDHCLSDWTFINSISAFLYNLCQCSGQVGIVYNIANLIGKAVL